MPSWREALCLAEPGRSERLRDPAFRTKLTAEFESETGKTIGLRWDNLAVEKVADESHADSVGKTIAELAADQGVDPIDVFLDLSLSEGLETWFQMVTNPEKRGFADHVAAVIMKEPFAMAGSSDGGAHLASFVGADYTTNLLTTFVPDTLSLEEAIFKLSGMPAIIHGLNDRGFIREGCYADLVLLDLDRLKSGGVWLAHSSS